VGAELSSWWTSHDLSIAKYDDNGAIKTLNSTDANQVLPTLTNVIKSVTSILSLAGSPNPNGLDCSDDVRSALGAVKELSTHIKEAQKALPGATPNSAAALAAAVTAYANESARITTTAPIHFTLAPKDLAFDKSAAYLTWSDSEIPNNAFTPASLGAAKDSFRLVYCLAPQVAGEVKTACTSSSADKPVDVALSKAPSTCGSDTNCTTTIVLREPKQAVLTIVFEGRAYSDRQGTVAVAKTFPISQWGGFTLLSTSVGLAENRTISFTLDEYGAKTSFGWKTDARAESISGGVAGVLDPVSTLASKIEGQNLADENAEINELQTQQKLNQLRACQAVIEAGGYTCPN
jgi:hypothetical protein